MKPGDRLFWKVAQREINKPTSPATRHDFGAARFDALPPLPPAPPGWHTGFVPFSCVENGGLALPADRVWRRVYQPTILRREDDGSFTVEQTYFDGFEIATEEQARRIGGQS